MPGSDQQTAWGVQPAHRHGTRLAGAGYKSSPPNQQQHVAAFNKGLPFDSLGGRPFTHSVPDASQADVQPQRGAAFAADNARGTTPPRGPPGQRGLHSSVSDRTHAFLDRFNNSVNQSMDSLQGSAVISPRPATSQLGHSSGYRSVDLQGRPSTSDITPRQLGSGGKQASSRQQSPSAPPAQAQLSPYLQSSRSLQAARPGSRGLDEDRHARASISSNIGAALGSQADAFAGPRNGSPGGSAPQRLSTPTSRNGLRLLQTYGVPASSPLAQQVYAQQQQQLAQAGSGSPAGTSQLISSTERLSLGSRGAARSSLGMGGPAEGGNSSTRASQAQASAGMHSPRMHGAMANGASPAHPPMFSGPGPGAGEYRVDRISYSSADGQAESSRSGDRPFDRSTSFDRPGALEGRLSNIDRCGDRATLPGLDRSNSMDQALSRSSSARLSMLRLNINGTSGAVGPSGGSTIPALASPSSGSVHRGSGHANVEVGSADSLYNSYDDIPVYEGDLLSESMHKDGDEDQVAGGEVGTFGGMTLDQYMARMHTTPACTSATSGLGQRFPPQTASNGSGVGAGLGGDGSAYGAAHAPCSQPPQAGAAASGGGAAAGTAGAAAARPASAKPPPLMSAWRNSAHAKPGAPSPGNVPRRSSGSDGIGSPASPAFPPPPAFAPYQGGGLGPVYSGSDSDDSEPFEEFEFYDNGEPSPIRTSPRKGLSSASAALAMSNSLDLRPATAAASSMITGNERSGLMLDEGHGHRHGIDDGDLIKQVDLGGLSAALFTPSAAQLEHSGELMGGPGGQGVGGRGYGGRPGAAGGAAGSSGGGAGAGSGSMGLGSPSGGKPRGQQQQQAHSPGSAYQSLLAGRPSTRAGHLQQQHQQGGAAAGGSSGSSWATRVDDGGGEHLGRGAAAAMRPVQSARPLSRSETDLDPSVWENYISVQLDRPPSRQKPPPEALHLWSPEAKFGVVPHRGMMMMGGGAEGIPPADDPQHGLGPGAWPRGKQSRPQSAMSTVYRHRPVSGPSVRAQANPQGLDMRPRPPSRQKPPPMSLLLEHTQEAIEEEEGEM